MARILPGAGVADIRGKAGGVTFARNRGGNYTRRTVTPTNAQTAAQLAIRSQLSNAAKAWAGTLTQAQRDAWQAFADSTPVTGTFGEQQILSGAQAYIKLRVRALQAGLTPLADAPADQAVTALTSATLTAESGTQSLSLAFAASPLAADEHLQVLAAPPLSAGITNVKTRLRLIHTSTAASTTPEDLLSSYQAKYGSTGAVGQKIVLRARVINSTNMAVSPGLEAFDIVEASA